MDSWPDLQVAVAVPDPAGEKVGWSFIYLSCFVALIFQEAYLFKMLEVL